MSKFFIIGVEGATIDGRVIKRSWLDQAAKNYDPAVYTARIWIEHLRGFMPSSQFGAYGDVIALKTEKIKQGLLSGKTALLASLKPTPELVEINKKQQKVFSSMEIQEEFCDTGEAYLVGLGATDSPASVGTDRLSFSTGKKTDENTFISEFISTELAFDEEPSEDIDMSNQISQFVSSLFNDKKAKLDVEDVKKAFSQLADKVDEVVEEAVADQIEAFMQQNPAPNVDDAAVKELQNKFSEIEKQIEKYAEKEGFDELKTAVEEFKSDYENLKSDLEKTPQFKKAPHDGGGEDKHLASC